MKLNLSCVPKQDVDLFKRPLSAAFQLSNVWKFLDDDDGDNSDDDDDDGSDDVLEQLEDI